MPFVVGSTNRAGASLVPIQRIRVELSLQAVACIGPSRIARLIFGSSSTKSRTLAGVRTTIQLGESQS
jgi:hypothetical protein